MFTNSFDASNIWKCCRGIVIKYNQRGASHRRQLGQLLAPAVWLGRYLGGLAEKQKPQTWSKKRFKRGIQQLKNVDIVEYSMFIWCISIFMFVLVAAALNAPFSEHNFAYYLHL